jgi:hypothetical protein
VRERWIRLYLGYYHGSVEDDRCSIPKNSHMPCHFATREEEPNKIGAVHVERLATLLRQGVEDGLEDAAVVEVGSIVVGVSTLHA